jgi:hypothetical protein
MAYKPDIVSTDVYFCEECQILICGTTCVKCASNIYKNSKKIYKFSRNLTFKWFSDSL